MVEPCGAPGIIAQAQGFSLFRGFALNHHQDMGVSSKSNASASQKKIYKLNIVSFKGDIVFLRS